MFTCTYKNIQVRKSNTKTKYKYKYKYSEYQQLFEMPPFSELEKDVFLSELQTSELRLPKSKITKPTKQLVEYIMGYIYIYVYVYVYLYVIT